MKVVTAVQVLDLVVARRPALCGADAHLFAFNYRALSVRVLVIRADLTSEGGWARRTLTVRPQRSARNKR